MSTSFLDRLFAPQWAGGWVVTRVALGLTLFLDGARRWPDLADAYADPAMVFTALPLRLADHVVFSLPWIQGIWAASLLGAGMWLWGGRLFRPGVLLWFVANLLLLSAEAVNIKAHDRLAWWLVFPMFASCAGERNLGRKARSPVARWMVIVVFMALYGSTGWLKFLLEPTWRTGEVLALHLLHPQFAGGPLATWLSAQPMLVAPAGWLTVAFEMSFPLLVWSRRINPWLLLIGASFHIGILALMSVGKFSFVVLSMYPVLLHPEAARRVFGRLPGLRA